MSGRLQGRVALITGASSGIGRAIARRFAGEGAHVVLADITTTVREGGTPTHELLGVPHIATDVTQEVDCEAAVAAALAAHGRLDVLVNDAAIGLGKGLLDCSREEWDRVLAVNLTGCFLMSRAAIRHMIHQPPPPGGPEDVRGRIVNISSQHGMVASPEDIAYGT